MDHECKEEAVVTGCRKMLFALLLFAASSAWAADPRTRAIDAAERGDHATALAILDSLLANDLTDLTAGYLAAREEDFLDRKTRARVRYLDLEAVGSETVALLALSRRHDLEQSFAREQLELGPEWLSRQEITPEQNRVIAFFPLDALGETEAPTFGLAWSYLLAEAWRGVVPVAAPLPSLLLVQDLLDRGRATRVHPAVSSEPVNTVRGLRARLAALSDRDGRPFLETLEGEWDEDVRRALERFQEAHGLSMTGEADLPTLDAIDRSLRRWLATPPAPLPPNLVPRAMQLLGASHAVRGTYRSLGSRLEIQLSLLDETGRAVGSPLVLELDPDRAPDEARVAAATLASRLRVTLPTTSSGRSVDLASLDAGTRILLAIDRGLAWPRDHEWNDLPESAQRWSPVARMRTIAGLDAGERAALERQLTDRWFSRTSLTRGADLEGFLEELAPWSGGWASPESHRPIGSTGIIRVRGGRP